MIELIGTLVDAGHAYVGADGSVFFDAQLVPDVRRDLRQPARRPAAGHRFEGASRPRASASTPTGRCGSPPASAARWCGTRRGAAASPGWHIECSAMSLHYLGETHRRAHRRHRPALPAPRGRARAVRGGRRPRGRAALGARRAPALRRPQDGEVDRQRRARCSDVVDRGLDPLALRLVFLEQPLPAADEPHLGRARGGRQARCAAGAAKVAEWAESPSQADVRGTTSSELRRGVRRRPRHPARAAGRCGELEKDADDPAPARSSRRSPRLDRLLGLDLARDVGKRRAGRRRCPTGAQELLDRAGGGAQRPRTSPPPTRCATSWPRSASP